MSFDVLNLVSEDHIKLSVSQIKRFEESHKLQPVIIYIFLPPDFSVCTVLCNCYSVGNLRMAEGEWNVPSDNGCSVSG
jgi:hypothetical protein